MKLLLVALAIGASLCLVMASLGSLNIQDKFPPSPAFEAARKLALSSRPDANGNFIADNVVRKEGKKVVYAVIWMPEKHLIGGIVVVGNRKGIVCFDTSDGHYEIGLYENDQMVDNKDITQEQADPLITECVDAVGSKGTIRY